MEKVDKTIDGICDWIQAELKNVSVVQHKSILPEMTKALAELVTARAGTGRSSEELVEIPIFIGTKQIGVHSPKMRATCSNTKS